jgi:tRNA modification GTPase
MYPLNDTIVAVASAPGGAARGIIRISGARVPDCLAACFVPKNNSPFPLGEALKVYPGRASRSPQVISGSVNLEGIVALLPCEVYFWPEGHSYTGQAVAEFHTFGSPPLLDVLLQTLCLAGARLAQPGEFTLRAFLSGRIDLAQAEAVLGAVSAADGREFEIALKQLAGGLSGPLTQLRQQLLDLLAHLEAGFDFAEEDVQFISHEEVQTRIGAAEKQVADLLAQLADRSLSGPAVRAVFAGRPNTGKSSLFNAMIRSTGAIVSPQRGTTRDYLTAEGDLDGMKCVWIDTAGISEGDAFVKAATTAAQEQHALATIRLLCIEAGRPLDAWEQSFLNVAGTPCLTVLTKVDLLEPAIVNVVQCRSGKMPLLQKEAILTSSVTGEGLDDLRRAVRKLLCGAAVPESLAAPSTAARCRQSLVRAAEALRRAGELVKNAEGEELIASEIRSALEELGKVVGAVYTDDILDRIFSRFCIGK